MSSEHQNKVAFIAIVSVITFKNLNRNLKSCVNKSKANAIFAVNNDYSLCVLRSEEIICFITDQEN